MKFSRMFLILCLVLTFAVGLCLTGCTQPEEPAAVYTVTFQLEDHVLSQQQVTEGQMPVTFDLPDGVTVLQWADGQGQTPDPFATPVDGDACYSAQARLALTEHAPYLFPDADGNILPDTPVDHVTVTLALEALVAPEARDFLPQIPVVSGSISRDMLMEILSGFYAPETVAAAFPEGVELTRSVFAIGMNTLLGRSVEDTFTLAEGYTIPGDITLEREDAWHLMEACVPHSPADQAQSWAELQLPSASEPGFLLTEGQLYYVQEDHFLLRDGYVGTLYFGPDGRYTSGNEDLDNTVVGLLKDMMTQNPEATRFDLLRVAYDYCHQSFSYRRTIEGNPEVGSHGWETQRALDMFETGKGNCYSFAAIFWALSRGLGYDTRAISGLVLADEQPHSWCFIEFDGKDYIFDPQWQYDYTRREIYEHDMFYLPSDNIYFWGYQWFE